MSITNADDQIEFLEAEIETLRQRVKNLEIENDELADTEGKAVERCVKAEMERETLRRMLAVAKNLIKAKGRYHTEQAYKALEQAITNAIKGES